MVVASAGPHINGEDNYQTLLDGVAADLEVLFNGTLIWATSTGAGCSVEPLADANEVTRQAMWGDLAARGVRTHNWPNFSAYDKLARAYWPIVRPGRSCLLELSPLAQRTDARIESPRREGYLDAGGPRIARKTAPGAWRPAKRLDGYRDCLHFCSPGPLRLAPALLQQVLRHCASLA